MEEKEHINILIEFAGYSSSAEIVLNLICKIKIDNLLLETALLRSKARSQGDSAGFNDGDGYRQMDSKQFRHTVVNTEGTDAQRHLGADRSPQNDNMWQLYKAPCSEQTVLNSNVLDSRSLEPGNQRRHRAPGLFSQITGF